MSGSGIEFEKASLDGDLRWLPGKELNRVLDLVQIGESCPGHKYSGFVIVEDCLLLSLSRCPLPFTHNRRVGVEFHASGSKKVAQSLDDIGRAGCNTDYAARATSGSSGVLFLDGIGFAVWIWH